MKKTLAATIIFLLGINNIRANNWDEADTSGVVGQYISADNIGSNACVAYYDSTNGDLKLAIGQVDPFNIIKIDTAGDVGRYTSIRASTLLYQYKDTLDSIWVSYYDFTNKNLKCAFLEYRGALSIKAIYTVDTSGDVGMHSDIDIDRFGYPYISYYDATNGNLKCAKWNGVSWDIENIDTSGDIGSYTSIRISDSNDSVYISYYDSTNGDLKLAVWDGSSWNIQKLDTAGDVGRATSMNGSDDVRILYYDATKGDLKSARPKGDSCEISLVDTAGDVGKFNSISRIGELEEYFCICWYDNTNKDLKIYFAGFEHHPDTTGNVGMYCACANYKGDCIVWFFWYDATNGNLKYHCFSLGADENKINQTSFLNVTPALTNRDIKISYSLPFQSQVRLDIYDLSGREIRSLVNEEKRAGSYSVSLDGKGLTTGIYFITLSAGNYKETQKLILMK